MPIQMDITEKPKRGRPKKYATPEEAKMAKTAQSVASNKRRKTTMVGGGKKEELIKDLERKIFEAEEGLRRANLKASGAMKWEQYWTEIKNMKDRIKEGRPPVSNDFDILDKIDKTIEGLKQMDEEQERKRESEGKVLLEQAKERKDLKKRPPSSLVKENVTGRGRPRKDPCWQGYKQIGMKDKGNKQVPNCVPTGSGLATTPQGGKIYPLTIEHILKMVK